MVELVVIGVEDAFGIDHVMHIHGYSFRLIGTEKLPRGTTVEEIIHFDQQGKLVDFNKICPEQTSDTKKKHLFSLYFLLPSTLDDMFAFKSPKVSLSRIVQS